MSGYLVETARESADYDRSGVVGGEDLAVWRSAFGAFADGNDFLTWQRRVGQSAAAAVIPEPASLALSLVGAVFLATVPKRKRL